MNPPLPPVDPTTAGSVEISTADFARMVRDMSEEGGYFSSDNLASNESGYLHVVGRLRHLGISGGAYVGVGPETNFTYIATIRPDIAFVVDIRRAAMVQHLMYKAIFHQARDRSEFLALLFSRQLPSDRPDASRPLAALLDDVESAPTTEARFADNLALILRTIDAFDLSLSSSDAASLEAIYAAFWRVNLDVGYAQGFATLKELFLETDLDGRKGCYLADHADYRFVRDLQLRNRVIPLVGDFAGTKALAGVAAYLAHHGYLLGAFYTSNVEEYLFQDRKFPTFADNVARFAISERAVVIRSLRGGWAERHPANTGRFGRTSVVAGIADLIDDYRKGRSSNYWKLVTAGYSRQ